MEVYAGIDLHSSNNLHRHYGSGLQKAIWPPATKRSNQSFKGFGTIQG